MSNWGKRNLTLNEISYAARDAWVAVAIVDELQKLNNVFRPESLMAKKFMANQKSMDVMDDRARRRKRAKLELKDIQQRASSEDMKDIEERKEELYKIMDIYRAEQPPNFDEDNLKMPQF